MAVAVILFTSQNILNYLKAAVSMMDVQWCGRYELMYGLYYYGSEGEKCRHFLESHSKIGVNDMETIVETTP